MKEGSKVEKEICKIVPNLNFPPPLLSQLSKALSLRKEGATASGFT